MRAGSHVCRTIIPLQPHRSEYGSHHMPGGGVAPAHERPRQRRLVQASSLRSVVQASSLLRQAGYLPHR
jgi:hypothetical protein